MTIKNYTQLKTDIGAAIPDTGASQITPADIRGGMVDIVDTMQNNVFLKNPTMVIKPFGRVDAHAGTLGYTLHTTLHSKKPFYGFKAHFINNAGVSMNGVIAAYSTSSTNTAPCISDAAWNRINVGGSNTWNQAAALSNAGGPNASPSITDSDFIYATSVPRTDGGTGYILMIRTFISSAGNTFNTRIASCADLASGDTLSLSGLQVGARSGDCVTTPANFSRTIADIGAAVYVELLCGKAPSLLLTCGDSITQGQDAVGGNFVMGASKLATNSLGIGLHSAAAAGASSIYYVDNGIEYMSRVNPTFAACAPWSTNDADAYTAGVESRILCNAAKWVSACYANGCKPLIINCAPKNGATTAEETVRRTVVAKLLTWCTENNIPLIDRDAVYTNYTVDTGGYKSGLNSDNLHPSATGYAAESVEWIRALTSIGY